MTGSLFTVAQGLFSIGCACATSQGSSAILQFGNPQQDANVTVRWAGGTELDIAGNVQVWDVQEAGGASLAQLAAEVGAARVYPLVVFSGLDAGLTATPGILGKTSATIGWDYHAWTDQTIESRTGPRRGIAFRCSATGHQMIGLGHGTPGSLTDWRDIDYVLYCDNPGSTGTPDIRIDGEHVKPVGPYTEADVFSIVLVGGSIEWYKNTVLLHTATPSSLAFPLYAEAAVYSGITSSAFMDVRWLSVTDVEMLRMFAARLG